MDRYEVTLAVGVGGIPLWIDVSDAARGVGGRVLSRLVMEALDRAYAEVTERDAIETEEDLGGERPRIIDIPQSDEDDYAGLRGDFRSELERLRELADERISTGRELQREAARARTSAECPDRGVRVTVQAGRVAELSIWEGATPDGEALLAVIQGAFARAAQRDLVRAAQVSLVDLGALAGRLGVRVDV